MRCCSRYLVAIMSLLLATSAAAREAELEQLTRDGRLKFTPVFHDGGKELVFVEQVNPTLYQIRRLVLATGANEPLHANAPTSEFEPGWSADGACYAFLKTRERARASAS